MTLQNPPYSRQTQQQNEGEQVALAAVCLLLGIGIGTVLALIFAPQSGDKTRDELSDRIEDTYEHGRDSTSKAIEDLQKNFEVLRKDVEKRLDRIRS